MLFLQTLLKDFFTSILSLNRNGPVYDKLIRSLLNLFINFKRFFIDEILFSLFVEWIVNLMDNFRREEFTLL